MTPELLLLLLGSLGLSGLGGRWLLRRAQRDFVNRVRTEWVRAGQIVRFGPVGVVCYGHRPRSTYTRGVFGALGLTGSNLVFDGHRDNAYNTSIPFVRVRWIGLSTVTITIGRTPAQRRALSVHHADSGGGWRVSTFITDAPLEIAQALGDECDLPVHDAGQERNDYGPARATRLMQDIYGEWSPDRDGELYLAPDRLLFDGRDAIPLDQIEHIDVLTQGSDLNPLASDLLRIEHVAAGEDDLLDVTGFMVRRAGRWADAIRHRAQTPIRVTAGRKKKE